MRTRYIVAGWVAAAAVAVVASTTAVGVAQGGLLSHPAQPMSDEEVNQELADAPTPASPSPSDQAGDGGNGQESPEPSPTSPQPSGQLDSVPDGADSGDNEAVFPSDGGTVLARCADDGQAELVWWVAEQGYSIDDVAPGPATEAEVEFEGEGEFELTVTCVDNKPDATVEGDD